MKSYCASHPARTRLAFCSRTLLCLVGCLGLLASRSFGGEFQPNPNAGAGSVIVHGKFGGNIFGFDLDPNGTEGLLAEEVGMPDGTIHAAVETFDQSTGAIIAVLSETFTQDDFISLGVVGNAIGLVEHESVLGLFNVKRNFEIISPLDSNTFTARWTPPLDRNHIINQVKSSPVAGTPEVAVYAIDVSTAATPIVFTSDVGANTFGSVFPITSPIFNTGVPPIMVFDSVRNEVILGHDFPSPFILPPRLGVVNLTTGKLTMTKGRGLGEINGMAVDSVDGILCTTTSFDSAVQFYDLVGKTGFSEHLPGGGMNTLGFGLEVAFDPVNKLFLIAQPFSGTASSGSSIQVYDTAGTLVESINGLSFQGGFNVFPIHITLNPSQRLGYVDGPELTTAIQSFNY